MLWDSELNATIASVIAGLAITIAVTWLYTADPDPGGRRPIKHHVGLSLAYLGFIALLIQFLPADVAPSLTSSLALLICSGVAALAMHVGSYQWRQRASLKAQLDGDIHKALVTDVITPPALTLDAEILVNATVSDYREHILAAEKAAESFALIQYRIAPHFLGEGAIQRIAEGRYGEGHPDAIGYRTGQLERRNNFLQKLSAGVPCREIYSRSQLLAYVEQRGRPASGTNLSPQEVVDSLERWIHHLLNCPTYHAGITDARIPLKYHLLGGDVVVLHEPVRVDDHYRVNSLFIYSSAVVNRFAKDFELIWAGIAPEWRSSQDLAAWIRSDLIPLARKRVTTLGH
ncbi:hypothetical protein [Ornithinimicrobium avium]|uniref:Uncharacterized protein n=1 Tax=Ornithinimicrobium avium TaxID=2283195 RepID=A0A345NPK3_9MICO|nr:hypothetical protein [Ornithinimicrobium avium]AXH96961.1 hypothetical protein DV701_13280 [Ornithinimicrobium avium]